MEVDAERRAESNDGRVEPVLDGVDPRKRLFLKKLIVGTAFAVPVVASYSVKDLAFAQSVTTVKTITGVTGS
jgi:hypothetical protein